MPYGYSMMGWGGGMFLFSWIVYILVVAALVLGIAALWKYLKK